MTKIGISVATAAILSFAVSGVVFAQFTQQTLPERFTTAQDVLDTIETIANWVFTILIIISVFVVILAAFQFVTAGGDPAQVTAARNKLIYAAVGILIALLARGFPVLVRGIV